MRKILSIFLCVNLFCGCLHLQEKTSIESEVISGTEDIFDYHLLLPRGVKQKTSNSMIVIFHGRGGDALRYIDRWLVESLRRQLIVLAPEWETPHVEGNIKIDAFLPLIDRIADQQSVSREEIYIAGVSAGAMVTRTLLERYPERWRGAMIIAHSPRMNWIRKITDLELPPIFFAIGELDEQSYPELLRKGVRALKAEGKRVGVHIDPEAGHEHREEWTKEMLDWMLQYS